MDPVALAAVASGALGVIGLLRRGSTPVTQAGQAVTRAGLRAAAPVLHQAQHLPWPLRPVTSSAVLVSAAAVTNPAALVVDGASSVVEAMTRANQVVRQVGSAGLGQIEGSSERSSAGGGGIAGAMPKPSNRVPRREDSPARARGGAATTRVEPRSQTKKAATTKATARSSSRPPRGQR
jgi:hypothetical protein